MGIALVSMGSGLIVGWFRDLPNLKGEVAVVTGAGHGIGKELCHQLAHEGAKVVCWDINEITAEETASEIRNKGGQAWSFQCDVSNKMNVANAAEKTR